MTSEWRRLSKSAGLWQHQTFRHGPILCWAARWRCALETLFSSFFLRVLKSFWRGHMRCVRLEWLTDWIDCERSLFTPCSWLRRNVKKIIGSLCCIVSSASWLTKCRSLRAEDRILSQEYRSQLLYSIIRIRLWIRQSSPGISPKDCFKYGKFWGVDNFSYKLICR